MKKAPVKWIMLMLLATVIWGFAFVAQVKGSEAVEKFWFNGLRFFFGGLFLLPVAATFEHKSYNKKTVKATVFAGVLTGAVLFCAANFQQMGVEITGSAGLAGFLTDFYTILVPIMCFIAFKEKPGVNVWVGAVLAIVGMYFLCFSGEEGFSFSTDSKMLKGEGLLLLCALSFAVQIIMVGRFGESIPPLLYSSVQFITCGFISLLHGIFFENFTVAAIIEAAPSLAYCTFLSVCVAYTLQTVCQRHVNPQVSAIILAAESIFSAIGGVIFGIDRLTIGMALGSILVFSGIIVSQIYFGRDKKE